MTVRRIALLVLVLAAMVGCQMYGNMTALVKGTGYTGGNMAGISLTQFTFNPGSVSFPAANNVTVTWTNNDGGAHTVTSDTGLFDSGNLNPGMTFSRAFPTAGSYPFHCTYHPYMTGTITVN
jgi:plastocyanin